MGWSTSVLLFVLGLGVVMAVGSAQSTPGYMDAEYYMAGGMRLAQGEGLTEPFLWNYLDGASGLPHPSHTYWMPLASFVAAAGMAIGGISFAAARAPFWILAAFVPLLTWQLALTLGTNRSIARLSGLLAVFPGFYLAYMPTTDTFAIYMVLGAALLILVERASNEQMAGRRLLWAAALGATAGLLHLARADGITWLVVSLVALLWLKPPAGLGKPGWISRLPTPGATLAGYLAVMGPWMARNLSASGSLLAPGGLRLLWLTEYNDLYLYPAGRLTLERWVESGLGAILASRVEALGANLQTLLAVQGEVFLLPLVLLGLWRLRDRVAVRAGILGWLLTLLVMTVAFPFAGSRGGFFHSGAAVQPLLWVAAASGLESLVSWAAKRRGWQAADAMRGFGVLLVLVAAVFSGVVAYGRVTGTDRQNPLWEQGAARYQRMDAVLTGLGVEGGELVMVNNPPGYYLATGRAAIPIPSGELEEVLAAARQYGARYLLLEIDQIAGGSDLFNHPGTREGLEYLASAGNARIYRFR